MYLRYLFKDISITINFFEIPKLTKTWNLVCCLCNYFMMDLSSCYMYMVKQPHCILKLFCSITHTHICMHAYIYTYTYTHIHYMYAHTHTCKLAYPCTTQTHTYSIHTHPHVHIHTYAYSKLYSNGNIDTVQKVPYTHVYITLRRELHQLIIC